MSEICYEYMVILFKIRRIVLSFILAILITIYMSVCEMRGGKPNRHLQQKKIFTRPFR